MDWTAAVVVFFCLVVLLLDSSRRWGRPRMYVDLRSRTTYVVASVAAALVVISSLLF